MTPQDDLTESWLGWMSPSSGGNALELILSQDTLIGPDLAETGRQTQIVGSYCLPCPDGIGNHRHGILTQTQTVWRHEAGARHPLTAKRLDWRLAQRFSVVGQWSLWMEPGRLPKTQPVFLQRTGLGKKVAGARSLYQPSKQSKCTVQDSAGCKLQQHTSNQTNSVLNK
ncbi:hypothetical protein O181_038943 [Austropuccinia psidii MF-1]|uniref:Uncharacterized protein n=1 Tax=Austropuccinia psidii MF-1 TaxID=1389203 RepID=A0A9Q3DED9_9BASI|nr:hypothetical protein [Austropuccinia psidii MF-1]